MHDFLTNQSLPIFYSVTGDHCLFSSLLQETIAYFLVYYRRPFPVSWIPLPWNFEINQSFLPYLYLWRKWYISYIKARIVNCIFDIWQNNSNLQEINWKVGQKFCCVQNIMQGKVLDKISIVLSITIIIVTVATFTPATLTSKTWLQEM